MNNTTTADPTTMTPVEIDTILAQNYYDSATAAQRALSMRDQLAYYLPRNEREAASAQDVRDNAAKVAEEQTWNRSSIERALAAWDAAKAQVARLREEAKPLHAEYRRRPWPRAFLVNNSNGHVHRSMDCSTCFPTTSYVWMVEYSGKQEIEIVEAAAARACTVCYPSAPVEALARPTQMFTPDEVAAAKAREEREAAKAKRQADKVAKGLTADGSEFVVTYTERRGRFNYDKQDWEPRDTRERFKTERAATQWVVQYVDWDKGWDGEKAEAFTAVVEAVAAKHGKTVEEVRADLDKKVTARRKRNGG